MSFKTSGIFGAGVLTAASLISMGDKDLAGKASLEEASLPSITGQLFEIENTSSFCDLVRNQTEGLRSESDVLNIHSINLELRADQLYSDLKRESEEIKVLAGKLNEIKDRPKEILEKIETLQRKIQLCVILEYGEALRDHEKALDKHLKEKFGLPVSEREGYINLFYYKSSLHFTESVLAANDSKQSKDLLKQVREEIKTAPDSPNTKDGKKAAAKGEESRKKIDELPKTSVKCPTTIELAEKVMKQQNENLQESLISGVIETTFDMITSVLKTPATAPLIEMFKGSIGLTKDVIDYTSQQKEIQNIIDVCKKEQEAKARENQSKSSNNNSGRSGGSSDGPRDHHFPNRTESSPDKPDNKDKNNEPPSKEPSKPERSQPERSKPEKPERSKPDKPERSSPDRGTPDGGSGGRGGSDLVS